MKKYCLIELRVTIEESQVEEFTANLRATLKGLNAAPLLDSDITTTRLPEGAPIRRPSITTTTHYVC